ncbi:MAG: phage tail tape measure protein [Deltaproteobacteria bacterium]|jgi:TP901 family phage tail tape measure protein|nr:phage tail tape measure protein [Deltaproteobacteria bacterium]
MANSFNIKINIDTILTNPSAISDLMSELERLGLSGSTEVDGLSGAFNQLGNSIKAALASLTAYMSFEGLKSITSNIIQTGANFEQTMLKVRASSKATNEQYERLVATANRLGAETEFSGSQAAQGFEYLAMAGFNVEKMIKALPGTMALATAGTVDLGTAADITTGVLTGMGLEVEQLGRVNDVLVKTFSSSTQNLADLGEAFSYLGPVAVAYGYDIETVAVLLGDLANAGIKGSMAGTALRSAFGDVHKVFAAFGESAVDAEGKAKNLFDAIELMVAKGVGPEQVTKIFGERAGPAVFAFMDMFKKDADIFNKQLDDMYKNAAGSTARMAETIRSGIQVVFDELTGALESLQLESFFKDNDSLKEGIRGITDAVRGGAGVFKNYAKDLLSATKVALEFIKTLVSLSVSLTESGAVSGAFNAALVLLAATIAKKLIFGLVNLGKTLVAQGVLAKAAAQQAAA